MTSKQKLVLGIVFGILIIALIVSQIQLNNAGGSLLKLQKQVATQQSQVAEEQVRKNITSGELSSAIRQRLTENPVSELQIKFAQ